MSDVFGRLVRRLNRTGRAKLLKLTCRTGPDRPDNHMNFVGPDSGANYEKNYEITKTFCWMMNSHFFSSPELSSVPPLVWRAPTRMTRPLIQPRPTDADLPHPIRRTDWQIPPVDASVNQWPVDQAKHADIGQCTCFWSSAHKPNGCRTSKMRICILPNQLQAAGSLGSPD